MYTIKTSDNMPKNKGKNKSFNILICNAYSDRNKGDSSILINTIKVLKQAFPSASISVSSIFGANQISLVKRESFRVTKEGINTLVGGLFPTCYTRSNLKSDNKLIRTLKKFLKGIRYIYASIFAILLLPIVSSPLLTKIVKHLLPMEFRKSLETFLSADVVIIKGGGYLTSPKFFTDLYLFRCFYPAYLSIVSRKPYALIGHSVWDLNSPFSGFLIKIAIDCSTLTTLREEISYQYLRSLNISSKNVHVLPDLAFLSTPSSRKPPISINKHRPLVGLTVRDWHFPKSENPIKSRERFITAVVRCAKHITNTYGSKVVVVPQVTDPFENDVPISKLIVNRAHSKNVTLLQRELSIEELLALYSQFEVLIGTRSHSIVFSLCVFTPTIAISYAGPKAMGFMRMVELQKFCLDINSINFPQLANSFDEIWRKRKILKAKLQRKMESIRPLVLQHGQLLREALERKRTLSSANF